MKKVISIILISSIFMLMGCGKKEKRTVTVNEVTHSIFYAPFYAAIQLGYFEDENIKIELTNGGGSDKSMTAVLTGQADIGFMGPETAVYVYCEGEEDYPQVFAQVTQRDGSFLVGKTPDDEFLWEKLKGKSVIGGRTGGMPEMTLEYVLKKHNIDINKDMTLRTDVSFDLMGGAFTAGEDDYVALFEPSASMMELAGQGYIVASVGAETETVAYTTFIAKKSYIEKNKELIEDFTKALEKGEKYVFESSAKEISKTIAPMFPDSDEVLIEKVIENYKAIGAWKTDSKMKKSDFDELINIITLAGIQVEGANFDDIVYNK